MAPESFATHRRLDWMAPVLYLAIIVFVVLCPFNVYPRNGVHWLSPGPGIYFDGGGIAYGSLSLGEAAGTPLDHLTVELWLNERKTSENWGPRVIFAIQNRAWGPPLLLGQWGGRLLLFSPDGEETEPWYEQFMLERRIARGRDYFVAVTIEPRRRTIVTEDLVAKDTRVSQTGRPPLDVSGRLILGASPDGRARWWGEMKGLAIYRGALPRDRITAHRDRAQQLGVRSLADEEDLIALFPFEEGGGETAFNSVDSPLKLRVPARFSALPEVLLSFPDLRSLPSHGSRGDAVLNVVLFVPLGWLLLGLISGRTRVNRGLIACGVVLAGGCLSFALEAIQLSIPARAPSSVDVVANTVGTALGAVAFLGRRRRRFTGKISASV